MSADALAAAQASPQVFDPTPPLESLAAVLEPYEALQPASRLESNLRERLAAYGRIGLIGPSGSGKSGVARYTLDCDELAMMLISVATEDYEKIAQPRGFLEILIGQLLSRANAAARISTRAKRELLARGQPTLELSRADVKVRAELGGNLWLLSGKVSSEITSTLGGGRRLNSTQDLRVAAQETLAAVTAHGRVPVIVADDTDRLLRVPTDLDKRERLFHGFFGEVLVEIADHLECGLLIAVHDEYRNRPEYADYTKGRLEEVRIPRIERVEQLAAIITRRASFLTPPAGWQELVDREALAQLALLQNTSHRGSVRHTLAIFKQALALAAADPTADTIGTVHVMAAAAT